MWQDLKFAFRQLLKHPISNLIIIATIALLLGAVSTIFASIRGQEKARNPFPNSDQLVKFWRLSNQHQSPNFPYSFYEAFSEELESFHQIGATDNLRSMTLTEHGEPVTFSAMKVTASVLNMTEIPPRLGRLFNSTDEEPGNEQIVILSHKVWREQFAEETDVIGKKIKLNDERYEVVGVLDRRMDNTRMGFNSLWLPLKKPEDRYYAAAHVTVLGRLKQGINRKQAVAELQTLTKHAESNHSPSGFERRMSPGGFDSAQIASLNKDLRVTSATLSREILGALVFGLGVAGSVVLIACFNVTNLLLIRATSRAREVAIRLSIGAARIRIIRQLLCESVLLASIGAILGLSVAQVLWAIFRSQHLNVRFDSTLFIFTAVLAIVLGALVGIIPATQSSRVDLSRDLKEGGQASGSKRRHRLRNGLVASQVAMAIILCVASMIMTRSYFNMQWKDLGFAPENLMTVSSRLSNKNYREQPKAVLFAEQGLEKLQNHPGVEQVGISFSGLFTFFSLHEEIRFNDASNDTEKSVRCGSWFTSENLLDMVGVTLIRGRALSPDSAPVQPEILVNEQFVSEHLEDNDPIGMSVFIRSLDQWMTVVGVVRDRSPLISHRESQPEFYASYRHAHYVGEATFLVRTKGPVKMAADPIREVIKTIDLNQPISQAKFVPDLIAERLQGPKAATIFLSALAGFGMLIAVLGIYGVVSFSVAERTHEVGIRMALGATRHNILQLLTKQGIRLLVYGGLPGLFLAFGLSQGIPNEMLYQLTPSDPLTYLLVIVLVATAGVIACLVPASKATRLKPMNALRYE